MIDFSKTYTETNAEKILKTDTEMIGCLCLILFLSCFTYWGLLIYKHQ